MQTQPTQMQPMMNYSDRFQNFQQQQQRNGINGRFVGRVEDVTANEVAMDGSVSLFPTNDLSVIYAKSWNSDGTIKTIAYKPILDDLEPKTSVYANEVEKLKIDLSENLTGIYEKLSEIENKLEKPKTVSRAKKDGDEQ